MTTTLTNAPADIIELITQHLEPSTLRTLRLVSHDFHDCFSPISLRNIAFSINRTEGDVKRLLEACSKPLSALFRYGQHLTVKTNGYYIARYVNEDGVVKFCKTIEQFQNLTSFKVEWEPGFDDTEETTVRMHNLQERVAEAAHTATGGRLERLVIIPWRKRGYELPRKLVEFSGLKELEFKLDEYGWGCDGLNSWGERWEGYDESEPHECIPPSYKGGLRSIVRNNPGLEVFRIKQGCAIDFHDADSLFVGHGGDDTAPALHTLVMKGIQFPRAIPAQGSPFTSLRHLNALTPHLILPLDNLWKSLEAAGTRLETLKIRQVSLPLCSYLASYSGLRQLSIKDLNETPGHTSISTATPFFAEALPRHASSLTRLRIAFQAGVHYLEGWSFTPKLWVPALRSLTALKILRLYPGDVDRFSSPILQQRHDPGVSQSSEDDAQSEPEPVDEYDEEAEKERRDQQKAIYRAAIVHNYQEVLDHVECVCQLETLQIIWPDEIWGCGTGHMQWLEECRETVSGVVKELRSRNGVPKVLALLSGFYRPEEEDGEWRFWDLGERA
ncbi:hypothetical protein AX16_007052 [Volvariella volvacea WC 439]|nr:hypothetical protein AX16_007052 [Volvariella volvacea WC 439]